MADQNKHCPVCDQPRKGGATCGAYSCRGELYRRRSERKYNLKAFDIWSDKMAYALGLMYSDGNLTARAGGSWVIQFVNTDEPTVKWFHSFVGNQHPVRSHDISKSAVCMYRNKMNIPSFRSQHISEAA